jgi:plastocyanin
MSQEAKRRLIGGVGMVAILTLFGSIVAVPLWSESATAASEPREIVLEARDLAFDGDNPTLEFRAGERVRLVVRNTDTGVLHSIRLPGIDDRVYHVRWGEQVEIEFTAPEAGGFEYTCPQHAPKMSGRIVIKPAN